MLIIQKLLFSFISLSNSARCRILGCTRHRSSKLDTLLSFAQEFNTSPGRRDFLLAATIHNDMAKSTKSTKASGFDADKFLEEMQEQSRKEKEAAQKKEARIMEYSIPWNLKDEKLRSPE